MSDYQILNRFTAENIQKATVGLLHYLGIATDLITEKQMAITDLVEQPTKAVLEICRKIHESYLVCSISDRTFSDEEQDETLDEVKENIGKYDQMLVFAVDLHKDTKLCRTEMATLTRALNRASKAAPVVIVFRYYDDGEVRFALSLCERTAYLQAGHTGEKVGRVNILRGINPQKTHAGHIRILEDMRLEKKDKSFEGVYQKWLGVFDNDVLTNKFYEELQNWYFWALKPECRVSFPNDVESDSDDDKYNPQNIIRLITRLIFVWFLRQKGLVLKELFKRDSLARLLKDFKPEDLNSSTYYRAVLQNLFFATLNKKIEEREFMSDEFIMNRNKGKHDVKTFMRHASDLQVSKEEFIELLHPVPFMNNSLFECLDNKEQNGHVYNWDGFSDSKKPQKQAFVPNYLFFAEDVYIDLSEEYGKAAASSIKVSGIINILSKYTFTVEENTPLDVDVALDPELLGKVFENLLAAYNPETKETVRKSTGSYYTPRPIVQYMVDESLIAYLKKQVDGVSEDTLRSLLSYTDDDVANPLDRKQTRRLVDAIFRCKVLDPACGSGAFPMGMLQQMAHLLSRVDSDNSIWEEVVIDNAIRYENTIDTMSDEEKAERQAEREKVFALSVDYPDYARKLYLIENCIYGVDLQSIAVQISRLRFFISLVCEQQPTDDATDNYGIHPLPNLEMKFVCANTLVKLENISETRELFANNEIINLIQDLKGVRHELFVVTNSHVKKRLLAKDKTIRDKIMLSTGDCYTRDTEEKIARHEAGLAECAKEMRIAERMSDEVITQAVTQDLFGEKEEVISYSPKQNKIKDINQRISYIKREIKRLQDSLNNGRDKAMRLAKQLTDWNPYDQNLSSPFFDADWMFGVTDGFDVVIGNPPYISTKNLSKSDKELYEGVFGFYDDTYNMFTFKGLSLCSQDGTLNYIIPKTFWTTQTKYNMRRLILDKRINLIYDTANPFDNVMVDTCVIQVQNTPYSENHNVKFLDTSKESALPYAYAPVAQKNYRNAQGSVLFKPTARNLSIYRKYGSKVKELYDTWWPKICTSRDIEKNKKELSEYRASLKPGDIALLGCLTEGGQGLATANNGKYLAVRKSSKWAKKIIESRPKKLIEAILKNGIDFHGIKTLQDARAYLDSITESEIAIEFDSLKESYGRDIFGQGYIYKLIDESEIADVDLLSAEEKENGIDTSKNYYVPYDKGDKDGNRWYLETPFAIAWSKENVRFLKNDKRARYQGYAFYFKEGFCWSDINTTYLKCRIKEKSINDVKSMSLYGLTDCVPEFYIVSVINSSFISHYVDDFVNNTQTFQINDARQLPIIVPSVEQANYIKEGFCWTDVNSTFLKARLKSKGVFDVVSMSLFSSTYMPDWYYVCLINTSFLSLYVDNFINNTSHFQINDARQLPIIIPTQNQLISIKHFFESAVKLKRVPNSQKELETLEIQLDATVRNLYGID